MHRTAGVLLPISALWGDYSIGSFGKEALGFIDFLRDCGFTRWQVLPFCMVDECNSPYKSYSTFGGNPYFVDLPTLFAEGLITREELDAQRQETPYSAEYTRLYNTRLPVLHAASKRVENRTEIEAFIADNPYIEAFCRFMSHKQANHQLPWYAWETEDTDADVLFMWQFIQYKFFTQWQTVKDYANAHGVQIIGDMPFYVAFDSCDVWSNKTQFSITADNRAALVAGVPPDYFCADGQLWGNPLYNWEEMASDGYRWWADRMVHMAKLFDGIRVDHFRAIESYWAVDGAAETARNGKWMQGPGMTLVRVLQKAAGDSFIIAEDLGDITPAVAALVEKSGFPCMRVFQFGFLNDGDSLHKPHHYNKNCVAYTGTHDNNTILGYLWELDEKTRRTVLDYCGHTAQDWSNGTDAILRTVLGSHADTAILPLQDVLGFGADTRLNIPGKADGNWRYRVTGDQISQIDREKFRRLCALYGR